MKLNYNYIEYHSSKTFSSKMFSWPNWVQNESVSVWSGPQSVVEGSCLAYFLRFCLFFNAWLDWYDHNCLMIYHCRFYEINTHCLSSLWLICWPETGGLHQTKTFTAKHKSTSVPCRYFRAHHYAKDELAFLSTCRFKAILYMQWLIRLIFITCWW